MEEDFIIPATIIEQIDNVEELDISYRNLHEDMIINDPDKDYSIRVPFSSLITKYRHYLYDIIVTRELDNNEISKYKFNPKALSLDLYGTPELWDTLLFLNDCKSKIDFNPEIVSYYDPMRLKSYINEIMLTEHVLD